MRTLKEEIQDAQASLRRFDEAMANAQYAAEELSSMGSDEVSDMIGGQADLMADGIGEAGSVYQRLELIIDRLERAARNL